MGTWNTAVPILSKGRGYAAKAPLLPVHFGFMLRAGTTDAPSSPVPPS